MQLSVNGSDIFVATGGKPFDPSLPAVVMLHGAGFDHSTWALHSRWFAHHGYSVLAPDLPGHGRSSGKPLPTIADMADWTAALLDAAKAPKAKLVGHSMGSLIALETAARHPTKVSGLSLIGTAAAMPARCALQRPRRLQRLSERAGGGGHGRGAHHGHRRRARHDDARQGRQ